MKVLFVALLLCCLKYGRTEQMDCRADKSACNDGGLKWIAAHWLAMTGAGYGLPRIRSQ